MSETYQCDYQFQPTKLDLSKYKMPDKPRDQWTDEEVEFHDLWCRLIASEIKYRQFTGTGFSIYPPTHNLEMPFGFQCCKID